MIDDRATPYSPEEKRVCEYLIKITDNQIGCGTDPIGFLIASHAAINRERETAAIALQDARDECARLRDEVPGARAVIGKGKGG